MWPEIRCFASNCYGHAATTGHYAGRHAARSVNSAPEPSLDPDQVERERQRVYAPLLQRPAQEHQLEGTQHGYLQSYAELLRQTEETSSCSKAGWRCLQSYEADAWPQTYAENPHELTRLLEVNSILAVSQLILHSCPGAQMQQQCAGFLSVWIASRRCARRSRPSSRYSSGTAKCEGINFRWIITEILKKTTRRTTPGKAGRGMMEYPTNVYATPRNPGGHAPDL